MSDELSYHCVYDVVLVAATEFAVKQGEVGRRGVVYEVRRYPDGTFRYTLGSFTDQEMGGIYWHEDLQATGERDESAGGVVDAFPRSYTSTRVTEDGAVLAVEGYVVLQRWMGGGTPAPDAATLDVYADSWLPAWTYEVLVDGEPLGTFVGGETLDLAIAPGEHHLLARTETSDGPLAAEPLRIEVAPDGYMMVSITWPGSEVADGPVDGTGVELVLEIEVPPPSNRPTRSDLG